MEERRVFVSVTWRDPEPLEEIARFLLRVLENSRAIEVHDADADGIAMTVVPHDFHVFIQAVKSLRLRRVKFALTRVMG